MIGGPSSDQRSMLPAKQLTTGMSTAAAQCWATSWLRMVSSSQISDGRWTRPVRGGLAATVEGQGVHSRPARGGLIRVPSAVREADLPVRVGDTDGRLLVEPRPLGVGGPTPDRRNDSIGDPASCCGDGEPVGEPETLADRDLAACAGDVERCG